jgi:hypothetical protein
LSKLCWRPFGLTLALTLLATGPALSQPKAVLELFTSQGCSSCPPADKLLGEYADRKDVLALSFNVDYWDYLGWKDTLASPDHTERQRGYAAARGDGEVYTPQIVINGREHIVGSNKTAIEAALKRDAGLPVEIGLTERDDAITVSIGEDAARRHGTLWLVFYQREVSVPIERGENTGKTITYANVVKKLRPIAMWKGEKMSVDLPKSEMTKAKTKRCAVLLQTETETGQPGLVLGAAMLNRKGN